MTAWFAGILSSPTTSAMGTFETEYSDIDGQTCEFRQRTQADCLTSLLHVREITVPKPQSKFF